MWSKKLLYCLAFAFVGCYPNGPEYIEEVDIVYTNYDNSFDFGTVKTFSLPDKIIKIGDPDINDDEEPEYVDPIYADPILASLRENMVALGWQEVDEANNPDFVVLPSASKTTTIYYYYDWWYWNWYYPGYGPGWGWYYPGYYPPAVTGYRSGSLFVQFTDAKGGRLDHNVPVRWVGIINGLLEGSTASINDRFSKTIDQAFKQSPYLKSN